MSAEVVTHPAVGAEDRRRWFALGVIVTAQFMVVLDISIVNVALPSIKTDLNFSQESLQWVITAYSIFFGGFLLLGGRLADLYGRRRLFMAGLLLFTVSSLLDALAWSEGSLVAFRGLQGLGAAMMSPAALSILTTTFDEGRERNRALGLWGAVAGSGGAVGAPHLAATDARGVEPERSDRDQRGLLSVLSADAVHAAGPALLSAQDRGRLHRADGDDHRPLGCRARTRDEARRQARVAGRVGALDGA